MSNGSERTPERTYASPLEVPAATSSETGSDLKSVDGDPWAGFTGESQADREAAELTDPLLGVINEQRSRIAALEAERDGALLMVAEASAVIDSVSKYVRRVPFPKGDKLAELLSASPSTVLDQVIREAKAEAWDEGYEAGAGDEAFAARGLSSDPDAHEHPHSNPYRNGDAL